MEEARERVEPVVAAAETPSGRPSPMQALASLQSGMGNRAFAAMASRAVVAREYTESPPVELPPWRGAEEEGDLEGDLEGDVEEPIALDKPTQSAGGGAAPAGNNFKRPAASDIDQTFADGNAAVAHMNSGAFIGEASCQFDLTAGDVQVAGKKGAYKASVSVTWSTAASSHMKIWNPSWANMSADDKAAVASMRAALLAHEVMHFDICEKAVAGFTTIEATGATRKAAVEALRAKAPTVQEDWQKKLKAADDAYDAKTNHGRNQAAVGGTDVKLDLKPAGKPSP